ncbi:MAG: DUF2605 domain-containing protein [Cyanobacteria bacterium P01_F01_bin.42]
MLDPSQLENLEPDLLKNVLEPLFDDFQHWFSRAKKVLEQPSLEFLSSEEQISLLESVTGALEEVNAARALFSATDGKAGVDTKVVLEWHQLVTLCWKVLIQASRSET